MLRGKRDETRLYRLGQFFAQFMLQFVNAFCQSTSELSFLDLRQTDYRALPNSFTRDLAQTIKIFGPVVCLVVDNRAAHGANYSIPKHFVEFIYLFGSRARNPRIPHLKSRT